MEFKMTFDELIERVTQVLYGAGLQDAVVVQKQVMGDVERLLLTRKLRDSTRYLRITPVPFADRAWDFEALGGSYGNSNPNADFDGRRGGSGDYIVNVVKLWLIALADWNDVLPFESQGYLPP
jgi:hypothetical protein